MKRAGTVTLAVLGLATLFVGQGAHAMGKKATQAGPFLVASDVPAKQTELLLGDIQALRSLNIQVEDAELARVLKLEKASAASLYQWLNERVNYVVGEKFIFEKSAKIVQKNYHYPSSELPDTFADGTQLKNGHPLGQEGELTTVMSNEGAMGYFAGRLKGVLVGLKIPGAGIVNLTSPRAGVIQIGPGLFRPLTRSEDGNGSVTSIAGSYSRLSTFFHEARHSDGNGKSLSFMHAKCPVGHDYAGAYACDRNLNGPYTVGALTEKTFLKNCKTCTKAEKEALKLSYLDSKYRVMTFKPEVPADLAMEYDSLKAAALGCEFFLEGRAPEEYPEPAKLPAICRQMPALQALLGNIDAGNVMPGVKSTEWDETPEGSFQSKP